MLVQMLSGATVETVSKLRPAFGFPEMILGKIEYEPGTNLERSDAPWSLRGNNLKDFTFRTKLLRASLQSEDERSQMC